MKLKTKLFPNLDNLIAQANPNGIPQKSSYPTWKPVSTTFQPQRKHNAEQLELPIEWLIAKANPNPISVILIPGFALKQETMSKMAV